MFYGQKIVLLEDSVSNTLNLEQKNKLVFELSKLLKFSEQNYPHL